MKTAPNRGAALGVLASANNVAQSVLRDWARLSRSEAANA